MYCSDQDKVMSAISNNQAKPWAGRARVTGAVRLSILFVVALLAGAAWFLSTQDGRIFVIALLSTESTPRAFDEPGPTQWVPKGIRSYSSNPHPAARPVTFGRALHTDLHGSDEIATAIAPMFEFDWTAEANMFIAEGPVFDGAGNVYFSPLFPPEDVLLVSIDGETGARRWVLEGKELGGAGTPLVLEDPESGEDLIYTVTYGRAVATDIDGNILWDVQLAGDDLDPADNRRHCFGANYHIQSDSIVAAMGDGRIQVLDRKTGENRLAEPFVMPGAPTAVTNFKLPSSIAEAANIDIAHMYPPQMAKASPVESVLHAAAGELQQITNFFSIDSNSGRIWVASTLTDEADGVADGWSDYAGLYGLDMERVEQRYKLKVAVVAQVPGGTASTPAISADGKRLYLADAFDSVYALDADSGEEIWSFNVEDKVTGSINVAADNGELYANTRTEIWQLFDRGDHAELGWQAELNMYQPGRFQSNMKRLGAEIAANGLAFVGAVGISGEKQKFPFKLGAGIIDRKTGKIRYFADGAEDSVSSTVTGPDGGQYVGNSPLRRVLGRATFGEKLSPQPVQGGITRFKPVRYDLFLRDVLKAAADRAANAAQNTDVDKGAVEADIFQIGQLLRQSRQIGPKGLKEKTLEPEQWAKLEVTLNNIETNLAVDSAVLQEAATALEKAWKTF